MHYETTTNNGMPPHALVHGGLWRYRPELLDAIVSLICDVHICLCIHSYTLREGELSIIRARRAPLGHEFIGALNRAPAAAISIGGSCSRSTSSYQTQEQNSYQHEGKCSPVPDSRHDVCLPLGSHRSTGSVQL